MRQIENSRKKKKPTEVIPSYQYLMLNLSEINASIKRVKTGHKLKYTYMLYTRHTLALEKCDIL